MHRTLSHRAPWRWNLVTHAIHVFDGDVTLNLHPLEVGITSNEGVVVLREIRNLMEEYEPADLMGRDGGYTASIENLLRRAGGKSES